jgi:outer membrane protein assembly factor BamB
VVVSGSSVLDLRTGAALGELDDRRYAYPPVLAVRSDVIMGHVRDREAEASYVSAIDPVSQAERWRSPSLGPQVCGDLRVRLSDDVALVLACAGRDVALDLGTGAQLWNWPVSDAYREATASATMFYRAQFDDNGGSPTFIGSSTTTGVTTVEAVNARSGVRQWSTEPDGRMPHVRAYGGQSYAFGTSRLCACDDASGDSRWTWESPDYYALDWLAGSDDQLVVAGHDYTGELGSAAEMFVVAVDPASGSTRWQVTLPEPPPVSSFDAAVVAIAGDMVVAVAGSSVYAIVAS